MAREDSIFRGKDPEIVVALATFQSAKEHLNI